MHIPLEEPARLAPSHVGVRGKPLADEHYHSTQGPTSGTCNGHVNGPTTNKKLHFLLPFSAHNERTLRSNIEALRSQADR